MYECQRSPTDDRFKLLVVPLDQAQSSNPETITFWAPSCFQEYLLAIYRRQLALPFVFGAHTRNSEFSASPLELRHVIDLLHHILIPQVTLVEHITQELGINLDKRRKN